MRPCSIVLDLQAICVLPGTSYSVHPPVLVTIFVVMAPYGRKLCKQSFVYYTVTLKTTKIVCYARFGCLAYPDKAVQGHTAHTTGGAVQTAQLRCWTEVECTRVRLRYGAERQLHVSIVTL